MATILVVDDMSFMRQRTRNMLEEHGYAVITADNGQEAVDRYKAERPDAVLMDITMPVMGGMEALEAIRGHDPRAKVAMVTAVGQERIVIDAIKLGARDFVKKPIVPERVLEAVEKMLAA